MPCFLLSRGAITSSFSNSIDLLSRVARSFDLAWPSRDFDDYILASFYGVEVSRSGHPSLWWLQLCGCVCDVCMSVCSLRSSLVMGFNSRRGILSVNARLKNKRLASSDRRIEEPQTLSHTIVEIEENWKSTKLHGRKILCLEFNEIDTRRTELGPAFPRNFRSHDQ